MKNIALQCVIMLCACAVNLYADMPCASVDKEKLQEAIKEYSYYGEARAKKNTMEEEMLQIGLNESIVAEAMEAIYNVFTYRIEKISEATYNKQPACKVEFRKVPHKKELEKISILEEKYHYANSHHGKKFTEKDFKEFLVKKYGSIEAFEDKIEKDVLNEIKWAASDADKCFFYTVKKNVGNTFAIKILANKCHAQLP